MGSLEGQVYPFAAGGTASGGWRAQGDEKVLAFALLRGVWQGECTWRAYLGAGSSHRRAGFWVEVPGMVWLELLRQLRGWRWRAMLGLAAVGAYWFSRGEGFGAGSSVWFPGAAGGVVGATTFLAFGSALLGVDALGLWERQRASRLLATRLVNPLAFVASRVSATTLSGLLVGLVIALWPAVAAELGGRPVLWSPTVAYLLAAALPVALCGAAAGLLTRSLFGGDITAVLAAWGLVTPVLLFRVVAAPASEFFLLSSESLGILVPVGAIVREGALTAAPALLFLGLGALWLPAVQAGTPERVRWPLAGAVRRLMLTRALERRPWTRLRLMWALSAGALGGYSLVRVLLFLPLPVREVDWSRARQPEGGIVPAVRVVARRIILPDLDAGEDLQVTLRVRAEQPSSYVATDFGRTVKAVSAQAIGRESLMAPEVLPSASQPVILRVDPPLAVGEEVEVNFRLRPTNLGRRAWERAYHPGFHRLGGLGNWYGEPAAIDFLRQEIRVVGQRSPFTVIAPAASPLTWAAGAARVEGEGGRTKITQELPGSPGRLIAAELLETRPPTGDLLNVHLLTLADHAVIASHYHAIYAVQLRRLARALGQPPEPLVLYEVPEQAPKDLLALRSSQLEYLQAQLPEFDDFTQPTRPLFLAAFPPVHRGLVHEVVTLSLPEVEDVLLLRDGLIEYLHVYALDRGEMGEEADVRRDLVFVPWRTARRGRLPFDVGMNEEAVWLVPWRELSNGSWSLVLAQRRAVAFHHQLRGLIGDDAYGEGVRRLMEGFRERILTREGFEEVFEEAADRELDWFFTQWLDEGVLPELRVTEAQAILSENAETKVLEYRTIVSVINKGTGAVEADYVLVTEGQPVHGRIVLKPGEVHGLNLVTMERPVAFEVDPDGWVVQRVGADRRGQNQTHDRVMFKAIRQL